MLYAGTEQAVYFSIDDGENWQPLRLNMPATSIRDLVVKDDDVVVGTHGRSFWILDDVTPLRQIGATTRSADAILFAPQRATRVKRSLHTDTPFPPEEPAGQNPPDGAIFNYYLKAPSSSPIVLEITDSAGKLVRRFASNDKPLAVNLNRINPPQYWIRPFQSLKNEAGMQRFVWDLLYPEPPADNYDLPISAIYKDTPFGPQGPAVMPGVYTVKLTVDGKTYSQKLNVRIDPRIKTSPLGLKQQFDLSMQAYAGISRARNLAAEVRKHIADLEKSQPTSPDLAKLKLLLDGPPPRQGTPVAVADLPLARIPGAYTHCSTFAGCHRADYTGSGGGERPADCSDSRRDCVDDIQQITHDQIAEWPNSQYVVECCGHYR